MSLIMDDLQSDATAAALAYSGIAEILDRFWSSLAPQAREVGHESNDHI